MWEASAYSGGAAMEMDEMTLAKNEESGADGAGHKILGHFHLPTSIISLIYVCLVYFINMFWKLFPNRNLNITLEPNSS